MQMGEPFFLGDFWPCGELAPWIACFQFFWRAWLSAFIDFGLLGLLCFALTFLFFFSIFLASVSFLF